jgi:hypothetical protein
MLFAGIMVDTSNSPLLLLVGAIFKILSILRSSPYFEIRSRYRDKKKTSDISAYTFSALYVEFLERFSLDEREFQIQ